MAYTKRERAGGKIFHGGVGRIKVNSEMNSDREPPSRQVWVEMWHKGRCIATSSGNLVENEGRVDFDSRVPEDAIDELTPEEMAFLEPIMEQFEGRKD